MPITIRAEMVIMFFDPISAWLVALIADGAIIAREKLESIGAHTPPPEPKPSWYQEPHRDETGKIIIENCKLYDEDLLNYGAVQTMKWVEYGKYNLTPRELKIEEMRIIAKYKNL